MNVLQRSEEAKGIFNILGLGFRVTPNPRPSWPLNNGGLC